MGQCSRFLSEKLPGAVRIKTPSTSAAAQSLLEGEDEELAAKSAAICSATCATVFDGLEVLCEGVQNVDSMSARLRVRLRRSANWNHDRTANRTRFYVISYSPESQLPSAFRAPVPKRALVRISLKPAPDPTNGDTPASSGPAPPRNRLVHLVMGTLLTTFGLPTSRIDRRPSLSDIPFDDVYFVELEASSSVPHEEHQVASEALWDRVKIGLERIKALGGEAAILGVW